MDAPVGNLYAPIPLANTSGSSERPDPLFRSAAIAEAELEAAIVLVHTRLVTAITAAEMRVACDELVSLVNQRSTDRVRFMERMRGLR